MKYFIQVRMEKIEKMCVRRVHRHAARKVGAVGSAKRLARAAPATKVFRLAAIAEQNSNRPSLKLRPAGGIELNDRRRPQNVARPAAAALPNGWPFPGDFQLLSNGWHMKNLWIIFGNSQIISTMPPSIERSRKLSLSLSLSLSARRGSFLDA